MTGDEWLLWIAKIIGASFLIPLAIYIVFRLSLSALDRRPRRR
ncbi:MAG TPA: hypothetical protein P5081_04535 [Phycisphaerae bacterium]|nr:hypothetical protein [Phycisphaerae bacterium]HRW52129.1 hypothetical protein [Phycisphaerae bacterium]